MREGPSAAIPRQAAGASKQLVVARAAEQVAMAQISGQSRKMRTVWPFRRRDSRRPGDRDEEALRLQREALSLAERGLRLATHNGYLQAIAIVVAIAGVLVAWRPWSGSPVRLARVRLVPESHNAFVPKAVQQLSTPPPYPADQAGDHCGFWWKSWFVEQHGAEASAVPTVEISAPASADVTVTDASVRVFTSSRPTQLSFIQCLYGAGPIRGTIMNVDLDRPRAKPTIVSDAGQDVPLAVPDAVINIDPGHTEYIAVYARGRRRLYAWSLQLHLVVDQHPQTVTLGSVRRPLRSWLGPAPSAAYDYDEQTHAWRMLSADWPGP